MTKLLIAGLGSIGRRHLRNLKSLGESNVVLLRSHRSTLPDEELRGYPIETDIGQALKRHRPDAVIVTNPTSLHLDVAIPAAEAGCAILLEKPISHSLNGVDKLRAAMNRNEAPVVVGFQLRYHPGLVRARGLIADGRLGRVLSSRVHFSEYLPAWHPWEDYKQGYAARSDLGGGVLLTQCHSLDYLPWLVGPVVSTWGYLAKVSDLDIDVEDSAEIAVQFADGSPGSLHIDFAQQPSSHRVEIAGSRGSVSCDLVTGTTRFYDVHTQEWDEQGLPQGWERNAMFVEEMQHFLAVARGNAEPACTLQDGIRVMHLIAAIQESNRSGRRVNL
jgi:predicted dehydrogenase